jgi:carbon monoxide dehydrogenase subunit G
MKLHEEFVVAEPVGTVWRFFDQPESVAGCMPGVEYVNILDDENVQVRATQSVGPMTATFDAKVTVLERVPEELIRFRAAGRSVRGAIGNVRTDAAVKLRGIPAGTSVAVDSDVVLAGALGSVGQKVIARQASKVTAEFAANLQRALSGEAPPLPLAGLRAGTTAGGARPGDVPAGSPFPSLPAAADPWSRVAAALSGVSVLLSVIVLVRQRRRAP